MNVPANQQSTEVDAVPTISEWWEVEFRATNKSWWDITDYVEAPRHSTMEEAQAEARRWAEQIHPHADGSTIYYDARVVRVVESRQTIEFLRNAKK